MKIDPATPSLPQRLASVRLFLCDVDGILTDTSVWMGSQDELKRFNIQDGLGLRLLQKEGIKVGWVSNRPSFATTQRAHDLKIDFLVQAYDGHKVAVVEQILKQTSLTWAELCYMGDDIVDLGVLK
ncbi:MAG TPA: phenylphosphate carboxylase subunit delta, partial [Verrucomicrobiae bacterium]|nr:phenylphosphate carboxylase subunit delta [Verrucomicrobiae bacterium]